MVDLEKEIKDTKIHLCLDCGKCTVVCPVAQRDPEFVPRLIAQRRLGRSSSAAQDETILSCLNCYMCVERCPYLVKYPEFIESVRAEAFAEGFLPQCTHGGALQSLMHLMVRKDLKQNRMAWLPRDIELAEKCDTIFFVGCSPYFDIIFDDLEVNTLDGVKGALRLLNHAQIPFDILKNERCCGRDLFLQGDREGFMALAEANMEEFSRHGVKKIITNCPEGYYTLKVIDPKMLGSTGIEVKHMTEIIAPMLQSGEFNLGNMNTKVTYQDSCMLGRCSRVFDEPRQILEAVAGLELVEMEENRDKSLCCGASPWVHCGAVNREIQQERLTQAENTKADVMVTSCPKCQIHLKCAQKKGNSNAPQIEIDDLANLAARSLG